MTILCSVVLSCFCLVAVAQSEKSQLVRINEGAFSDGVMELLFHDFKTSRGARAEHFFRSLGIRFVGENGSVPRGERIRTGFSFADFWDGAIVNDPMGGTSEESALTILFEYPVRRVGFQVGNGKE